MYDFSYKFQAINFSNRRNPKRRNSWVVSKVYLKGKSLEVNVKEVPKERTRA